jgi:putative FmdB family regulatory protein
MPTYEYECEKCGLVFEKFQSITAEPLKTCSKQGCGGKVHRLLSAGGGFLFKGSGFYVTDYRSDAYKKAAKSEPGGSAPKPAGAPAAGANKSGGAPSSPPASSGGKK